MTALTGLEKLKVVLLCAGEGTRLRPLTHYIPKCLVPIHGRPLLSYWLELFLNVGVQKVLINTHYKSELVTKYVQASKFSDLVEISHEPTLLNTAGTVKNNLEFIDEGPVMLVHADNLSVFDLREFYQAYLSRPAGSILTMMTFDSSTPESCGIIEENQNGLVVQFHEKVANPPGHRANAAVYIFGSEVLEMIRQHPTATMDFSLDIIPRCLGRINTFHNHLYHRDIGTMSSWMASQLDFMPHSPIQTDIAYLNVFKESGAVSHMMNEGEDRFLRGLS